MKQCRTCGTKLPDNVVTCTRCGSNDLVTVGQSQQGGMRPQGQQMQGGMRPQGQQMQGGMRPQGQQGMRPQGQQMGGMRPQPGQQMQGGMRPQGQQNGGMRPQQPGQQMGGMRPQGQQNNGFDNGYGQNQNQMNNDYGLPNDFDINGDAEVDLSKKKKGLFGKGNKAQNNNNNTGFGMTEQQNPMQSAPNDMNVAMQAGGYPVITVGQWVIMFIQLIIPIWNIIFIVKTLTNKHENPTKQNYLKAYLIIFVISMIFVVIINAVLGSILMGALN